MSLCFWRRLVRILRGKDLDVVPCKTWAEAAVLWRTSRPDVVVLDHNLPDGNALDLIVRLRPFDPDIPIIILTAEASIDLAVQLSSWVRSSS